MKTISEKLREIRLKNKLNHTEMGRNLGLGRSTYSRIESGHIELTIKHLKQLAQRFNVSLDWLIAGRTSPGLDAQDFSEFGDYAETAKKMVDDMRKNKPFMLAMFSYYFEEKAKRSTENPPNEDKG